MTIKSLVEDSHLFENGITEEMFAQTHSIIVLDLSGTQYMTIVRIRKLRLECNFAKPMGESIALILLNQFEIVWEITPDGSVLLDSAP